MSNRNETPQILRYTDQKIAEQLLSFIAKSPTCFQAVDSIRERLEENGFSALWEHEEWNLLPGGKYYVIRNQSSVLAFCIPEEPTQGASYRMIATHDDSPCFKLKDDYETSMPGYYLSLNVEKYGGMICSSWMDRPLSIAGRVVVEEEGGIASRNVCFDRDMALIPNVAIHMNRNANDDVSYNPQVDMIPLYGSEGAAGKLKAQLADTVGVAEEKILSSDLYLYARTPGTVWGAENEFLSSPRLDDLMCVWGAMEGFLATSQTPTAVPVLAVFDNEEVGSHTRQGAASSFLEDTLTRVDDALCRMTGEKPGKETFCRHLSSSFLVSADNAHAVHPNHPEYADAKNRPRMNGGIVIKFHAGQSYATDAVSAAIFRKVCEDANVPVQVFANRSDMRGGSTLGNIAITRVPLMTVDIGLAQLAMHSAYETAGVRDIRYLIQAASAFYETTIQAGPEGNYRVRRELQQSKE